ncbi:1013_t:CDS:10, partial [Rhizophagus irregularis]
MCPGLQLNNNLVLYELPHILVLAVTAALIATLSWKLYQQFGWNIYKKIGGDIEMQKRFKAILIFKMLLKVDLLFVFLYNVLILPPLLYIIINSDELKREQIILVFGCFVITVLVLFFQALAYKSMEKEWKFGIIAFILFWIFVVSDFAYLALKLGVASFIQFGIYSWIILMCNFTICALLTFAYAIIVIMNFGKGLREYRLNILSDDDDIVIDKFKDIEKGQSSSSNKVIIIKDPNDWSENKPLAIIAITLGALFFGKLSQQLDWDIYKKIGGDIEVRTIKYVKITLKLDIKLIKAKAHSENEYNDPADILAKEE